MSQDNAPSLANAIAFLEKEIERMEGALSVLRRMEAQGLEVPPAGPPTQLNSGGPGPVQIQSDTFFSMTATDAAKKYLQIMKRPQSTGAIEKALRAGGMATTAKNLYSNLYTAMTRDEDFVKPSKGVWGLKEWYPGRVFKKDSGKPKAKDGQDEESDS